MAQGLEDLKGKRDEISHQILAEQDEKRKIEVVYRVVARAWLLIECQADMEVLAQRLAKVTQSLEKKTMARDGYDKTISETEAAYMKVNPIPCAAHQESRSWRVHRRCCMFLSEELPYLRADGLEDFTLYTIPLHY